MQIQSVRTLLRVTGLAAAAMALVVASMPAVALEQSAAKRPPNTFRAAIGQGTTAAVDAPVVNPQRMITFRLRAPEASKVELWFEFDQLPMTREGSGAWNITVGPKEPEVYTYYFVVDGVRVNDMSNASVEIGRSSYYNFVEVPGSPPRFDEVQEVPHGTLHVREYTSSVLKQQRRVFVYVPPQYDSEPSRRFPTLYLRHGNGSTEMSWMSMGRAGVILENLLARSSAVPMIIVMPNGYPNATGEGSSQDGIEAIGEELIKDIVPLIEHRYRALVGPEHRALAGLSMGAGQAFLTGLRHQDTFAWVGAFSSGLIGDADFRLQQALPGFLENPTAARKRLRLLFLSCGTEDPRYAGYLDLVDALKEHSIQYVWFSTPGKHEWKVWRHSLAEMLTKLFR